MPITINKKLFQDLTDLYDNYVETYSGIYGNDWIVRTSAAIVPWECIAVNENNGHMIAVSAQGTTVTNNFAYSNDTGITWTPFPITATNGSSNSIWNTITFGNGRFVAISESTTSPHASRFAYSTSTNISAPISASDFLFGLSPADVNWKSVVFGNGYFVAVAYSGTASTTRVMTSQDGITWVLKSNGVTNSKQLKYITYSSDLRMFLAITDAGSTSRIFFSKYDGTDWTEISNVITNGKSINSATWSQKLNLFVVVGNSGFIATSPNGVDWIERTLSIFTSYNLISITWSQELEMFITISNTTATSKKILTSTDGINWNIRDSNAAAQTFSSIIWNRFYGVFVAVADTPTTANQVILTRAIGTNTLLPKNAYFVYPDELISTFEYTITDLYVTVGSPVSIFPVLKEEYEFLFYLNTVGNSLFPLGLRFNSSTGEISGTPTTPTEFTTYEIYARYSDNKKMIAKLNITVSGSAVKIKNFSYPQNYILRDLDDDYLYLKPSIEEGTSISFSMAPSSPAIPSGIILDSKSGIISGNFSSSFSTTNFIIRATNSLGTSDFNITMLCEILRFELKTSEYEVYTTNEIINGRSEELFNFTLGYIDRKSYCNLNFGKNRGLLSKNVFYNSSNVLTSGMIRAIINYKRIRKSTNSIYDNFFIFEIKGNLSSTSILWNTISFRTNSYPKNLVSRTYYASTDSTVFKFTNTISSADFIQNGATEIIIA